MEWLRIGEVSRRTGLTPRTLRHYDDLGLLVPSGRSGGDYRLYAPEDLDRLLAIQHLKSLGLGLEEIADALDDPAVDASDVLARHIDLVKARIVAERELLARLHRLRDAADLGWEEVLDTIALTERLRHPQADVRVRAALTGPRTVPVADLIDVLRGEEVVGVREAVTWAIVQHGRGALAQVLALTRDADPALRRQAAHVLGKLADARGVPALAGLLGDPDASVVAKAAFALGQVGGPDATDALAGALGSGGDTTRATVVSALAGLGPSAAPAVTRRLAAASPQVRADAAEALGSVGGTGSVAALSALVGDPDEDVRIAALMALAEIGGDQAAVTLASARGLPGRAGAVARRVAPGD